jgi:hypothetical protein
MVMFTNYYVIVPRSTLHLFGDRTIFKGERLGKILAHRSLKISMLCHSTVKSCKLTVKRNDD